jgi:O-antigen/teichoic acid export membrane protein
VSPPDDGARVSYRARAIRGGSLSLGGFALSQALNFLAYAILARLATPDDFGVYAAGALISGIAMLFAESGILAALITREDRVDEAASTAFLWTIAAGLGLVAGAILVSPLLGLAFGDRRVAEVTAVLSGILLVRALGIVPEALLQRRLSFVRRIVIEPMGVVAFATVAIVATSEGAGYWGLVMGTYAQILVHTTAAWLFVRWRPRPRTASWELWREMAGYARHVLVSEMIRRILSQLDTFLVGRYLGLAALGQYRYAVRLAALPHAAWVSVGAFVLLPIFARLAGEPARLRAAIVRSGAWLAIGVFPVSLLLVPLGLPAALLVLGDQWRDAGEAMMALAGYPIGHAVISLASEAYKASQHPQELIKVHSVTGAITAAAIVALLPLGLVGVALGVSLAALASAGYALVRLQAVVGIPVTSLLREFGAPLLCGGVVAAVGYGLDAEVVNAAGYATAPGLVLLSLEATALLALYVLLMAISPRRRRMLRRGAAAAVARTRRRSPAPAPPLQ